MSVISSLAKFTNIDEPVRWPSGAHSGPNGRRSVGARCAMRRGPVVTLTLPECLAILSGVVPASVIGLLKQQVLSLAENQISTLSIAFLFGFLVSMSSANSGVSALFDALNIVPGSKETRGSQFYMRALLVTLGSVVYGLLALVGVLPHASGSWA